MSNDSTVQAARSNYKLMAVLTTTSPLHITEPGAGAVGLDGKPSDKGFPLTRHTRLSVSNQPAVLRASVQDDLDGELAGEGGVKGDGPFTKVPVIPANSLRGMLRRRAAEEISQALLARGEKLSVGAYNVLICGAATGNPDSADPTVDEMLRSSRHPYFGTFGGGPRMLRSRLRVDVALPITDVTTHYLDPYFGLANMGVDAWKLVEIGWKRRSDDVFFMAGSHEHRAIIDNYEQSINEYQDLNAEEKAKRKAGSEDSVKTLATLNAKEFVKIGTHFALTLELTDATAAQAGMLIKSLLGLVKLNRIGGGGALGCGHFMLQHVCLDVDGERHSTSNLLPSSTLQDLKGQFAELVEAWEASAKDVSAGEIEAFAKPSGKLTAKKEAAAKAAAKSAPKTAGADSTRAEEV